MLTKYVKTKKSKVHIKWGRIYKVSETGYFMI